EATRWARDAALRALAALGRAIPSRGRAAQEAIEAVLREPSFFAVLSAAEALGKLGRSQALPALRRLHSAEVDARLQKAAHDAIAALTGPSTPETWKAIRTDLEQARRENHALRERVERLEVQLARRDRRNAAIKRSG